MRANMIKLDYLAAPLAALAFGGAIAVPGLLGRYGIEIGFQLMLYIVLAEAWNMLAGYGGLVSLGSAAFVGLGAYVFIGLSNALLGDDIAAGLLMAGLAGAVMAVVIAPAMFRMRGLYFTVGTLALGEALRIFMVNVPWFGGSTGLYLNIDFPSGTQLYLWALGLILLAQIMMSLFAQSRFSVLLRAIRDDEDAAAQLGVRTAIGKTLAFCAAGFFMAAAGGLQAYKLGAVEPYGVFGVQWSIDVLTIVVIGGFGQRFGAIIGTLFVVALGELLADYPAIHVILTAVILIAVVRFAPKGLCGLLAGPWPRLAKISREAA